MQCDGEELLSHILWGEGQRLSETVRQGTGTLHRTNAGLVLSFPNLVLSFLNLVLGFPNSVLRFPNSVLSFPNSVLSFLKLVFGFSNLVFTFQEFVCTFKIEPRITQMTRGPILSLSVELTIKGGNHCEVASAFGA